MDLNKKYYYMVYTCARTRNVSVNFNATLPLTAYRPSPIAHRKPPTACLP